MRDGVGTTGRRCLGGTREAAWSFQAWGGYEV